MAPLPHMYHERAAKAAQQAARNSNPTVTVYAMSGSIILAGILAAVVFFLNNQ